VARVSAAPAGGACPVGQPVALASAEKAAIRYTLDGTPPGPGSPRYEKPILLEKPGLCEIRFAAEGADGRVSSRVFGALYEVGSRKSSTALR